MKLRASKFSKTNRPRLRSSAICGFFLFVGIYIGWKGVPGFFKANFILLTSPKIWNALLEENDLDTIYLEIPFKSLQRIDSKRNEALKKGVLISSDDDFVQAVISTTEQRSECKIRLKGDLPDHWSGDKFSLRVETKNGDLIKGMSRFSLQDPKTRTDTEEWLFLQSLKREDIMSVRYDFVNLVINGKKMGIYAIEEHFSKELIESNNRREGVIVRFDDYFVWKKAEPFLYENISWHTLFRSSSPIVRLGKRVSKNEDLGQQKETAFNLLRSFQNETIIPSKVFDAEKLGKFLAITHIWQAEHGLGIDDINFFFNPITSLLEPIGFDAEPTFYGHYCFFTEGDIPDSWVNLALTDPKIVKIYIENLERYCSDTYLQKIRDEDYIYESKIRKLLLTEFIFEDSAKFWDNYRKIFEYDPWLNLFHRCAKIDQELSEERIVFSYATWNDGEDTLSITLRNTTTQPVEIIEFEYNGTTFNPSEWLKSDYPKDLLNKGNDLLVLPSLLNGNLSLKNDLLFETDKTFAKRISQKTNNQFRVKARFLGSRKNAVFINIPMDNFEFNEVLLPSFSNNVSIPFKFTEENNSIFFPSGTIKVEKDIFIPAGFEVNMLPGTVLQFAKYATFISESPILARGKPEAPIIFQGIENHWSGILLSKTNSVSIFENVEFKDVCGIGKSANPNGISRSGWNLTGGVTFFRSSVCLENCTFNNFSSEDALNIISTSFSISNCIFNSALSDAFDGDFVNGIVKDCRFENISGDGVDFSGSIANVVNSDFINIADKAISVGEQSKVQVFGATIKDVTFGIVSKDSSITTIRNSSVENATKASFSAFQKKPSFGPASIIIKDTKIHNCFRSYLIQTGSTGVLNDRNLDTSSFKTGDLYHSK